VPLRRGPLYPSQDEKLFLAKNLNNNSAETVFKQFYKKRRMLTNCSKKLPFIKNAVVAGQQNLNKFTY